MKKYFRLLAFEVKTILRDPLTLFMCGFPLLMLFLSSFVFPRILLSLDPAQEMAVRSVTLMLLIMALTFGGFLISSMTVFLLVEHKDEHTLHTIAATPAGLSGYLRFKVAYVYALSAIGNFLVLLGTKWLASDKYMLYGQRLLDRVGLGGILAFSLVAGLFAPALALLIGAFARNKVEGFAWIKGSGIIALAPLLMGLPAFEGAMQYVLGVFPNFWAARGLMLLFYPLPSSANLGSAAYFLIGALYNLLILTLTYRFFLKKQMY